MNCDLQNAVHFHSKQKAKQTNLMSKTYLFYDICGFFLTTHILPIFLSHILIDKFVFCLAHFDRAET